MITLEYNTVEKDLAAWGFAFDSATLQLRNLATSVFSAVRLGDVITDAAVFPYRGKVIIRSGRTGSGTTWASGQVDFIGYRMQHLVSSSGSAFGVRYSFADAWHFLETTPYQQFFQSRNVDGSALMLKAVPELMLFTWLNAGVLSTYNSGEQIAAVLQFVIDAFAAQGMDQPFIIGDTSGITLDLPSYQCRQVMCAAVIKKCLELSPDVNLVVDYTTDVAAVPTPTFNFKTRAQQEASPVTMVLHNGTNHVSLDIVARDDLKPRAVVIWYKITGSDTGQNWVVYLADKYGPNGQGHASDPDYGLDVLTQFIDLQGQQTISVSADVVTETVDATHATDATRLDWWKLKSPKLASDKVRAGSLAIAAGTVTVKDQAGATVSLATYPRELKEGPLPSWTGMTVKEVTIIGKASYEVYTTAAAATGSVTALRTTKKVDEEIAVKIQITDATTTTYSTLASVIPGEDVPGLVSITAGVGTFLNGIAKDVYTSLATLQYEGQDVRVEAEPTTLVSFGNVLNLSGGLTAWATMKAQLQSIVKHYGNGHTEVSFGPPQGNSAAQMFELMQYSRPRFEWFNPLLRETANYVTGGTAVDLNGRTPAENTSHGSGGSAEFAVFASA
jgi:hypothetical protein